MDRKKAWITAATVSVCLATGSLAVMANTGLLTAGGSKDPIGKLAPGDITVAAAPNLAYKPVRDDKSGGDDKRSDADERNGADDDD